MIGLVLFKNMLRVGLGQYLISATLNVCEPLPRFPSSFLLLLSVHWRLSDALMRGHLDALLFGIKREDGAQSWSGLSTPSKTD